MYLAIGVVIGATILLVLMVVCIGLAFWYTITGRRDNQGKPVQWL